MKETGFFKSLFGSFKGGTVPASVGFTEGLTEQKKAVNQTYNEKMNDFLMADTPEEQAEEEREYGHEGFIDVSKGSEINSFSVDNFATEDAADKQARVAADAYEAELNEVWVYACAHTIARSLASVPVKMYRNIEGRDGEVEKEEIKDKESTRLLRRVNSRMSFKQMVETIMVFLELTGNAYLEKVDPGNLDELYTVQPMRMRPVPDTQNGILAWQFRTSSGNWKTIDKDRIVQFKYMNPKSDFIGLPPYAAAIRPTRRDLFAQRYAEKFFENDGTPGGVFETDRNMSRREAKRVIRWWNQDHQGVKNAHLTGVLTGGLKYKKIQPIPDTWFPELRKMSRTEILAAFGVPSVMVGVLDDASYSNANIQYEAFWTNTMSGKMDLFEEIWNNHIQPEIEPNTFIEFDRSTIKALQEDATAKSERELKEVAAGAMTLNEYRAERNRPTVPWGDVWWAPLGVTPVSGDPLLESPQPEPSTGDQEGAEIVQSRKRLIYTPERRVNVAKAFDRTVLNESKAMSRKLATYFEELGIKEANRLKRTFKTVSLDNPLLVNVVRKVTDADIDELVRILTGFGFTQVERSGKAAAKEVGARFVFGGAAQEEILRLAKITAEHIAEVTEGRLAKVLAGFAEAGEVPTSAQLAATLRNDFAFSPARADRVARSATVSNVNFGAREGYRVGGVEELEWLTITDDDARDTHIDLDAVVKGIDEGWTTFDGYHLKHPGDPNAPIEETINCRCTIAPVVKLNKNRSLKGFIIREVRK